MEKNSNSILISILCGVGVCFLCLGIVFLLPAKNSNNLKGRNYEDIKFADEAACNSCVTQCQSSNPSMSVAECKASSACATVCATATATATATPTPSPTATSSPTPSPSPTSTVTCPQNMGAQSSCIYEARGKCGDYTGCDTTDANGCYSYTCSTPSPTPTSTPKTCYDKSNSCYGTTKSSCDNVTYFDIQSKCYEALSGGSTPTPTPTATSSSGVTDDCQDCFNYCMAMDNSYDRYTQCKTSMCVNDCQGSAFPPPPATPTPTQKPVVTPTPSPTPTPYVSGDATCDECMNDCRNYSSYDDARCLQICVDEHSCAGSNPNTSTKISRVEKDVNQTLYLNAALYKGYGYRTVQYTAYDQNNNVINGTSISWQIINGGSLVANSSANGTGFSVTYKGTGCNTSGPSPYVRATLNGSSKDSTPITIDPSHSKWSESLYNQERTTQILISQGEVDPACVAVSEPYVRESDGKTVYKYIHNRCCGNPNTGSSTPTPTPKPVVTPTPTPTPKPTVTPTPSVYGCYKDSNNAYHWTNNPESSWRLITTITKPALCEEPKPGCYEDKNGNYDWGYHADDSNYTIYHGEITDDAYCVRDETYACYQKDDDYVWSKTQPTGYTKTSLSYDKCENLACYLNRNTKKMVWGAYSKNLSYVKLYMDTVDDQGNTVEIPRPYEYCKNNGCYKDKETGNYDWGDHSNDDNYELIESVTDPDECTNEVPVKPTGVTVSTIVYVFMAILMAFGIGFIYYSTVLKKNN